MKKQAKGRGSWGGGKKGAAGGLGWDGTEFWELCVLILKLSLDDCG